MQFTGFWKWGGVIYILAGTAVMIFLSYRFLKNLTQVDLK